MDVAPVKTACRGKVTLDAEISRPKTGGLQNLKFAAYWPGKCKFSRKNG
jgi:hypothetical protein